MPARLAGHFRLVPEKRALCFESRLYRPLKPAAKRALDVAVARYGRFAGVPVTKR